MRVAGTDCDLFVMSHRQVLMVHHPNISSPTSQVKLKLIFMSMSMFIEPSSISIVPARQLVGKLQRVDCSRFCHLAACHAVQNPEYTGAPFLFCVAPEDFHLT